MSRVVFPRENPLLYPFFFASTALPSRERNGMCCQFVFGIFLCKYEGQEVGFSGSLAESASEGEKTSPNSNQSGERGLRRGRKSIKGSYFSANTFLLILFGLFSRRINVDGFEPH
jgi:hypothetical protein